MPLHSHLSYFWTSADEFAEAAGFLAEGLGGTDHCLVIGSQKTLRRTWDLLAAREFDPEALQASGRMTVLAVTSSAETLLNAITAAFDRALAAGVSLVRFFAAPPWGETGWPDDAALLSLEGRLTAVGRRYPSVTLCLYDMRSLPLAILDQGGVGTHPLMIAAGRLFDTPNPISTKVLVASLAHAAHSAAERKRAQEAVAESEARFAKVFQASPVPLSLATVEKGRIIEVNERLLEFFGYRREEVIGRTVFELDLWVDSRLRRGAIERLDADGALRDFETRVRLKSGEVRDVIASAVPVDLPGEEASWLAVNVDITERKRAEEEARAAHERLATLSRRLVEVQETERAEIARELHDEVGQLLTGLRLMIEAGPNQTGSRHEEMKRVVDELTARVRDLSTGLRPPMLDALGLLPALLWQIERFEAQTGVGVQFRHANLDRRFPPEVETTAFRVVQEALTNVARHAGVRQAAVEVTADSRRLAARIEDRGRGFDVETALAGAASGLAGMRERARLLGGRLTLDSSADSSAGSGTRVALELPLRDPGADDGKR